MNRFILLLLIYFWCTLSTCKKGTTLNTKIGKLEVEFVDFEQSCNWNLRIIDKVKLTDFHEVYTSEFLYGDMNRYNQQKDYQFGDTFTVEYEVLEECPYPHRLILCNIPGGVPIKIIGIE